MLEIRRLASGEHSPKGVGYVEVTKTLCRWRTTCSPQPTDTVEEAIKQAVMWAEENSVYVVYVSEG